MPPHKVLHPHIFGPYPVSPWEKLLLAAHLFPQKGGGCLGGPSAEPQLRAGQCVLDDRSEQDVVSSSRIRAHRPGATSGSGSFLKTLTGVDALLGRIVAPLRRELVQTRDAAAHPEHLPGRGSVRVEERPFC